MASNHLFIKGFMKIEVRFKDDFQVISWGTYVLVRSNFHHQVEEIVF